MFKYCYQSLLCPHEKVTEEQLSTDRNLLALERSIQQLNRRNFFGMLAKTGALAAVGGVLVSSKTAFAQTAAAPSIPDVLNFALNLEYLEANFYLAATGQTLDPSLMGSGAGALTGLPPDLSGVFDPNTLGVAQALALDEMNHIADLQGAITGMGATPIPQPAINYSAAGTITTQAQFLMAARQFTALGNSAYAGAAQFLVSDPTTLGVAAQILGAEGQHNGALRLLCVQQGVVSPAIDAQDRIPSATQYVEADTNGLPAVRTPQQVLGVAYGASTAGTTNPPAGVTSGGFFPNGVNGNITST